MNYESKVFLARVLATGLDPVVIFIIVTVMLAVRTQSSNRAVVIIVPALIASLYFAAKRMRQLFEAWLFSKKMPKRYT